MIKKMTGEHVEKIVKIHATSWDPSEISVKLGLEFLKLFYKSIVSSDKSFCLIYEERGDIIGYCTGFLNYNSFNKEMRKQYFSKLLKIILIKILTNEIGYSDLKRLLKDKEKVRKCKYPEQHLGALALNNNYKGTKIGIKAIFLLINNVLKEIENNHFSGCWGTSNINNIAMQRIFEKCGFELIDEIVYNELQKILVYEITF